MSIPLAIIAALYGDVYPITHTVVKKRTVDTNELIYFHNTWDFRFYVNSFKVSSTAENLAKPYTVETENTKFRVATACIFYAISYPIVEYLLNYGKM